MVHRNSPKQVKRAVGGTVESRLQGDSRMSNAKFSHRQGDVQAMLRVMRPLVGPNGDAHSRRRFLASWCRLVGNELGCGPRTEYAAAIERLSPRQQETLKHLLTGDSEKQIAAKLSVSRHTVHVYVKGLYRHFGASSRAELLARWVKTG
jgi:DNA-binding CsgD family transcriptional regulator